MLLSIVLKNQSRCTCAQKHLRLRVLSFRYFNSISIKTYNFVFKRDVHFTQLVILFTYSVTGSE